MFSNVLTYRALEVCLRCAIPFAMYKLPGKKRTIFYAAPSLRTREGRQASASALRDAGGFFITRFAEPLTDENIHCIPCECTAERLLNAKSTELMPIDCQYPENQEATDREEYTTRIATVVERLKQRGTAKTVMSAIGFYPAPENAVAAIRNLFDNSPNDFCNCYFHPHVGFWMGASPELLLHFNAEKRSFSTMALAGTTPADTDWDDKNKRENEIVSDYIARQLAQADVATFKQSQVEEVEYGPIKHLRVRFRGTLNDNSPQNLLNLLNPTPALNGYPRETALKDIDALEPHSRFCYGGLVGFRHRHDTYAFVNIRCAQFTPERLCIYSGGGIMPDSDPAAEWNEMIAKRTTLYNRINTPSSQSEK